MHICGLKVIVMPKVPPSLRWGRNCVVVEPGEAAALAMADRGDNKQPLVDLLDEYESYLSNLAPAA